MADSGRQRIDDIIEPTIANPYPHYRDVSLVALGVACAVAPSSDWARTRLQTILRTGLDSEGVTFTFDLPSVLVGEAERRGLQATELTEYVNTAQHCEDRWGTAIRAASAHAAVLFRDGAGNEAWEELKRASTLPGGFAGYATLTYLSLANRCFEFGDPAISFQPCWGSSGTASLMELACNVAGHVRHETLQQQRIELIENYESWANEPDVPRLEPVLAALARMPVPDHRRVYKDHVSARWASASGSNDWKALKSLILIALVDATLLDTLLGRLFNAHRTRLIDQELAEAIKLCHRHMTTGRPWELGKWR